MNDGEYEVVRLPKLSGLAGHFFGVKRRCSWNKGYCQQHNDSWVKARDCYTNKAQYGYRKGETHCYG